MRKVLDRIYSGQMIVAATFVVGILVVVSAQVALNFLDRFLILLGWEPTGLFVPSYAEITGFLRGAAGWLALAYTFRVGNHVRVSLFISNITGRKRAVVECLCISIALVLMTVLTVQVLDLTIESFVYKDYSHGIVPIPIWIFQFLMLLGLMAMCLALLDDFYGVVRGREPSYGLEDRFAYSPDKTADGSN